jgi:hypothetical protein
MDSFQKEFDISCKLLSKEIDHLIRNVQPVNDNVWSTCYTYAKQLVHLLRYNRITDKIFEVLSHDHLFVALFYGEPN